MAETTPVVWLDNSLCFRQYHLKLSTHRTRVQTFEALRPPPYHQIEVLYRPLGRLADRDILPDSIM